jgi:hypothetical protein
MLIVNKSLVIHALGMIQHCYSGLQTQTGWSSGGLCCILGTTILLESARCNSCDAAYICIATRPTERRLEVGGVLGDCWHMEERAQHQPLLQRYMCLICLAENARHHSGMRL